jgi:8-oxo-dGTP pyrophosphatase MutT (NUDIX family)
MNIQCLDIYGNTHTFDESEYIERLAIYGVHIKDNQVLLVRDMWAKHWEFPGGGIDEGETPEQALQRELMEETGLHLEKLLEPLAVHESYFLGPDEPKPRKSNRHTRGLQHSVDFCHSRFLHFGAYGQFGSTRYPHLYCPL